MLVSLRLPLVCALCSMRLLGFRHRTRCWLWSVLCRWKWVLVASRRFMWHAQDACSQVLQLVRARGKGPAGAPTITLCITRVRIFQPYICCRFITLPMDPFFQLLVRFVMAFSMSCCCIKARVRLISGTGALSLFCAEEVCCPGVRAGMVLGLARCYCFRAHARPTVYRMLGQNERSLW